jgi:hypothetical protein
MIQKQQVKQFIAQNAQSTSKNKPFLTIRAGSIKATVWANTITTKNGEMQVYNTTITKSYVDKEQQWQETTQFSMEDLPKVQLLCTQVYQQLVIKKIGILVGSDE